MPKIPNPPKKTLAQRLEDNNRVQLKEVANRLLRIENLLAEAKNEISNLWSDMYSKGLKDRGPLGETDELPF